MGDTIHYLDLEGLAINGLLDKVSLEDCSEKNIRKARIKAVARDGRSLETECIDYNRIVRVWITIKHYEKWSGLIVEERTSDVSFVSEDERLSNDSQEQSQ